MAASGSGEMQRIRTSVRCEVCKRVHGCVDDRVHGPAGAGVIYVTVDVVECPMCESTPLLCEPCGESAPCPHCGAKP